MIFWWREATPIFGNFLAYFHEAERPVLYCFRRLATGIFKLLHWRARKSARQLHLAALIIFMSLCLLFQSWASLYFRANSRRMNRQSVFKIWLRWRLIAKWRAYAGYRGNILPKYFHEMRLSLLFIIALRRYINNEYFYAHIAFHYSYHGIFISVSWAYIRHHFQM